MHDSLTHPNLMVDPRNTPDMINNAKSAVDYIIKFKEASMAAAKVANIASKLEFLNKISASLGVAGALVGFVFSFFGPGTGPDPEILKLQEMIRDTQTLVV